MKADIPFVRGSSAFEREDLKSKETGHLLLHFNGSDEAVAVILPAVFFPSISSVFCGAVADVCVENPWNLETMVMPPEVSTTDQTFQTDARVQGNLLREYEQKFADLPEHLQLTKLCFNAGLVKTVEEGQYLTTLDHSELDRLKGSCRENTLPRSDQSSQVKRMDPRKHEDRTSSGCGCLSSSRTLQI